MKLAGIPISVILILLVAAILGMKYALSSSPLFLFSLFNTIFFAITVGSYGPDLYEVDEVLPFFGGLDELGVDTLDIDNMTENSNKDDDYDDRYPGSDEDNEDNGSEDEENGWREDEEGSDDNLQKRIEDFIAKVNNGWREEKLRDKLGPGRPG